MKKIYLMLMFAATLVVAHAQVSVTFQVDMDTNTIDAAGVHIAGDFQAAAGYAGDWDPSTIACPSIAGTTYGVTVMIPAGTYEYKFINGDAWGKDEGVTDTTCGGAGGYGNNRFVVVPAGASYATPAHIFGSCDTAGQVGINDINNVSTSSVYPNPVSEAANIEFTILEPASTLNVVIYDAIGNEVRTLLNESASAGKYLIIWDGNSFDGAPVQSGVYFLVIKSDLSVRSERILVAGR